MAVKHLIGLEYLKRILARDFQKAIVNENLGNEKQLNAMLYEFLKLNLPFNISVKREVKTKYGTIDILIDNTYILELKYADKVGTLDRGIAEIIRYKNLNKPILMVILDTGKLKEDVIKKYADYYRQIGADTVVIKSSSNRKRETPVATIIRNKFLEKKFFTFDDISKLFKGNKDIILM